MSIEQLSLTSLTAVCTLHLCKPDSRVCPENWGKHAIQPPVKNLTAWCPNKSKKYIAFSILSWRSVTIKVNYKREIGMCTPNYLSVILEWPMGSVAGTRNVLILHLHWLWRWLNSYVIHLYFHHNYLGRTLHQDAADMFILCYKNLSYMKLSAFTAEGLMQKRQSVCHH